MPNVLYRIFSQHSELLYVGATTNPAIRTNTHEHSQPWWNDAAEIKLQHFGSLEELYAAEVTAIAAENPRYNVVHTARQAMWARKPNSRKKGAGSVFQRKDGMWVASIEIPSEDGKRQQKRRYSNDPQVAERYLNEMREMYALRIQTWAD